ncbi:MAG: 23S rRNA (guanosine2251-2'-O)-methyltransferase [Candidatus Midichloriaceae bacterium]|jgi:23S rRNA (guanosine2251-2'-O)-methyltransferase
MQQKINKNHKSKSLNTNNYWLYGKHPVISAINNPKRKILRLISTSKSAQSIEDYKDLLRRKDVRIETFDTSDINKIVETEEGVHQGIAVQVMKLSQLSIPELLLRTKDKKSILIFLDQVTDPQNIGAIIRNAAAFGADAVITTKDNAPSENASIIKASSGTFENVPYIQVTNITRTLKEIKLHEYWVAAITQNGENNLAKMEQSFDKLGLIFGSEGFGIRNINLDQADLKIKIKISNSLESLNVSNTTAIALYQLSSN